MRVLVVGGGAREHAIAQALATAGAQVVAVSPTRTRGSSGSPRKSSRGRSPKGPESSRSPGPKRSTTRSSGPKRRSPRGSRTTFAPRASPSSARRRPRRASSPRRSSPGSSLSSHAIPGLPRYTTARSVDEVDHAVASSPPRSSSNRSDSLPARACGSKDGTSRPPRREGTTRSACSRWAARGSSWRNGWTVRSSA